MNFNSKLLCCSVNHKYKRSNTSLVFSLSEKKRKAERNNWNSDISVVLASDQKIPEKKKIPLHVFLMVMYIAIHILHFLITNNIIFH